MPRCTSIHRYLLYSRVLWRTAWRHPFSLAAVCHGAAERAQEAALVPETSANTPEYLASGPAIRSAVSLGWLEHTAYLQEALSEVIEPFFWFRRKPPRTVTTTFSLTVAPGMPPSRLAWIAIGKSQPTFMAAVLVALF